MTFVIVCESHWVVMKKYFWFLWLGFIPFCLCLWCILSGSEIVSPASVLCAGKAGPFLCLFVLPQCFVRGVIPSLPPVRSGSPVSFLSLTTPVSRSAAQSLPSRDASPAVLVLSRVQGSAFPSWAKSSARNQAPGAVYSWFSLVVW
jgi:hypothetical protein